MSITAYQFTADIVAAAVRLFRRLGARLAFALAATVGALLIFALLAEDVLEGETMSFDGAVRSLVRQHASPALTSAMRFVTMLGSTQTLVALGLCACAVFFVAGWRRDAVLFVLTMAGASALNFALKLSFGRARPETFFDTPLPRHPASPAATRCCHSASTGRWPSPSRRVSAISLRAPRCGRRPAYSPRS